MRQLFVALALVLSLASFKPDQMQKKWSMTVHAESVSLNSSTLTIDHAGSLVMMMTSDGEREVKVQPLSDVTENWDKRFATSQPNAAVLTMIDGKSVEVVVRLGKPKLVNQKLTFPIKQLGKQESFQGQEAILFID